MDRIMADFVKLLNSTHSDRLHHDYSNTTTQQEHKGVQKKVCSIGKRVLKMNLKEVLQENIYFQNNISRHNPFPRTQL